MLISLTRSFVYWKYNEIQPSTLCRDLKDTARERSERNTGMRLRTSFGDIIDIGISKNSEER
jgi:hypothetical protein